MIVELLATLKAGKSTWKKGLILDDKEAPFPPDILAEIKAKTGTIRVIKADTKDPDDKSDDQPPLDKPTKAEILKMNKHDLALFLGNVLLKESKKRDELLEMAIGKLDDKE